MKWIVDRIEGNIAVVECNGKTFDIDVCYLPKGVKESDIIDLAIDKEETKNQEDIAQKRLDNLFNR